MKKILAFIFLCHYSLFGTAQDGVDAVDSTKCLVTDVKIVLNQGNKYTRMPSISLNIKALKAREMLISNHSTFKEARWQPFHQNVPVWEIDGTTDGTKTVYFKFRDTFKNTSSIYLGEVTLDREVPQKAKIEIVQDKELSKKHPNAVELNLKAKGAAYVMISNEKRFYGKKWRLLMADRPVKWNLDGHEDGKRVVFAKFRDHAGNESPTVSDEIIIDTRPPIRCKLAINNGQKVTTDSTGKVNLLISAMGATYMMLATDDSLFAESLWQPYDETLTYNIGRKDGVRKIFIKFKDNSDNMSVVTKAEIFQDTYPPSGCGITINSGATETYNPDGKVSLKLTAHDAEFMMISNSIDFATYKWQRFQESVAEWRLSKGKGAKTIYAIFKDQYGNQTGIYEASILAK